MRIHAILSHIHIYLSTFSSIHPQPPTQVFTRHRSINSSITVSIHPIIVSFLHTCWPGRNHPSLSLDLWNYRSLTLLFQLKDIIGLSGFLCLSNTYLSTTLSFSHFLLCILDETRKLRLHLSVNDPAIMDLITQSISPSGPFFFCFFLALCQKPVITDSAARHGCESQSVFPSSLIHLTHTVCGGFMQRLRKYTVFKYV